MTGNEGVCILFRVNFLRDPFSNHYLRFTLRGKTTSVFFLNPYSKLTSKTLQSSSPPTDRYSKSASRASLSLDQTGKKDLYPTVRVRPSVTDGMDRRTARRRRAASRSPSPCPCPTAIERANGSVGRSVGRTLSLSSAASAAMAVRLPVRPSCLLRWSFFVGVKECAGSPATGARDRAGAREECRALPERSLLFGRAGGASFSVGGACLPFRASLLLLAAGHGQRLTAALVLVYGTCWKRRRRNEIRYVCPLRGRTDGGRYKDRLVRGQQSVGQLAIDTVRDGTDVTGPVAGWAARSVRCTDIFRGPNPRDFAGFVALGGGSGEQRGSPHR